MKIKKEILMKTAEEYVGRDSLTIVNYLIGKEKISEFVIAEETNIEIHQVRNILYRLNNHNLAIYIRKKDRKKGWYISYWTLNYKRFQELYEKYQKKRVEKLKDKLKKEQESREGLFICPKLCSRMSFDKAMEHQFKCPECGTILQKQDNSRTIEHLKEMIQKFEAVA
ncbi:hypothetical protein GF327_01170 [Candidatus Woesearchaeota archaeon]|nr:hypothetical protein [Candidatus Woesearchaeota archaeon]